MKRKKLGILAPAPILAALGLIAATLAVPDAESRLAVPILGAFGILLTFVLASLQDDPDEARFLRDLMLLGVSVRFFLLALVHQSIGPYVFAPDQFTYEGWGDGLVAWLTEDGPFPRRLADTLQLAYPAMNAGLYLVFGPARAAPSAVNIFLSAWTAVPVYHLALLVLPRKTAVARWAAGLTVFFPSMMIWSVLNIREAPTILTIAVAVYSLVRVQRRADLAGMTGVVVSLVLLTLFREYLTGLVGLAGFSGILMGKSRSPIRSLAVGSVMLIALVFAFQSLGVGGSLGEEASLAQAQLLREDFQVGARSAYGQGADVSTPAGAIAYLPVGLAYFLLAPFPWEVSSAMQASALPETVFWWAVIPFGIWGLVLAFRYDLRSWTVVLSVLIVVTFAYALVESNVGTAYRHRAQVLPLIFLFCAVGIRDAHAVWSGRRAAAGARSRKAREEMAGLVGPDRSR